LEWQKENLFANVKKNLFPLKRISFGGYQGKRKKIFDEMFPLKN
jgi:hypothetical protein